MKYLVSAWIAVICLTLVTFQPGFAQYGYEKVDQITWGGRANNPIQIEVVRNNDKFEFYANNRSYYPYSVQLQFKNMMNLQPFMTTTKAVVYPGRSRLLTLTLVDAGRPIDYSYTIRYTMGDPDEKVDTTFPYLLPLTQGKKVVFYTHETQNGKLKMRNLFKLEPGDTVCAIRKGIVTALPDNDPDRDRIRPNTVEVRHADGTVSVYENIIPESCSITLGQKVYPGEPIGLVYSDRALRVTVFQFWEEGKLRSIDLQYAIDESKVVSARELTENVEVKHVASIVQKEMTKREMKKRDR